MITRRASTVGGGIAIAAIGLLVGIGSVGAAASDKTAIDVEALSEKPGAEDKLPDFLASGPQSHEGVDPDSARYQGSVEGVQYWLANDSGGQLCIISLADGPDQLSGSTCGNEEVVKTAGLSLGFTVFASELEYRAHFVPDEWSLRGSNMNDLSSNLAVEVIPMGADTEGAPTLTDSDGKVIELVALETSR